MSSSVNQSIGLSTDKDEYINCVRIGTGSYGTVYKAQSKKNGKFVAIKHMKFKVKTDEKGDAIIPKWVLREINILRQLQHPNIVKLNEKCYKRSKLYLIFELMTMDLKQYILSIPEKKCIPHELIKSYTYQISKGLALCHSLNIIHRDLKPENLLIGKDGTIKIADFGLSRQTIESDNKKLSPLVVTLWYRAPELLLGAETYTTAIDIWALGCTFAEMALKNVLFQGWTDISQLSRIFDILKAPTEESWRGVTSLPGFDAAVFDQNEYKLHTVIGGRLNSEAIVFLEQMLIYDPGRRVTSANIVKHPYFKGVNMKTVPSFYKTLKD